MFGERYFATRERLVDAMASIRSLAEETHVDLGEGVDWAEIGKGLSAPFLFVVCGEVNAGKSTLLNGLFGREVCRVSVLPETDRVLWYRYGDTARDEHVTPLLDECYRPVDFLRDFNLVDTPGTNSVVKGHQSITERFLAGGGFDPVCSPRVQPMGGGELGFPIAVGTRVAGPSGVRASAGGHAGGGGHRCHPRAYP